MIKGDTVYAIVKNRSNFKLEIIVGTITEITDDKIIVSKEQTPFETNDYVFPRSKAIKFIFCTLDEAEHKFNKIK